MSKKIKQKADELVCDVCKGVGTRCIGDETDDCWFCDGTGEKLKLLKDEKRGSKYSSQLSR